MPCLGFFSIVTSKSDPNLGTKLSKVFFQSPLLLSEQHLHHIEHSDFPLRERNLNIVGSELLDNFLIQFSLNRHIVRHVHPWLDRNVNGRIIQHTNSNDRIGILQHT